MKVLGLLLLVTATVCHGYPKKVLIPDLSLLARNVFENSDDDPTTPYISTEPTTPTEAPQQPTTAASTAVPEQPTSAASTAAPEQPTTAASTAAPEQPTTAASTEAPEQPTTAASTAAPEQPTSAASTEAPEQPTSGSTPPSEQPTSEASTEQPVQPTSAASTEAPVEPTSASEAPTSEGPTQEPQGSTTAAPSQPPQQSTTPAPPVETTSQGPEQPTSQQPETTTTPNMIPPVLRDCQDFNYCGFTDESVAYRVTFDGVIEEGKPPQKVFCDFTNDGWTVIQRRADKVDGQDEVDFDQYWSNYTVDGFGSTDQGSYWTALETVRQYNVKAAAKLAIDLWDCYRIRRSVTYDSFELGNDEALYTLKLNRVYNTSTAGDAFTNNTDTKNLNYGDDVLKKFIQNEKPFSTRDKPHKFTVDGGTTEYSCNQFYKGGWWFNECGITNLNGNYYPGCYYTSVFNNGIIWATWEDLSYSAYQAQIRLFNTNWAAPEGLKNETCALVEEKSGQIQLA